MDAVDFELPSTEDAMLEAATTQQQQHQEGLSPYQAQQHQEGVSPHQAQPQ